MSPEASTPDKQVFIVSLPCKHLFFLKFQVSLLLCDISSLMGLKFVILHSRQKPEVFCFLKTLLYFQFDQAVNVGRQVLESFISAPLFSSEMPFTKLFDSILSVIEERTHRTLVR